MMGSLATGKPERLAEFKKRKQRHVQLKAHPADVAKLLTEGWENSGRTLKDGRVVLLRSKPHDEVLENRFWSVLYHLGYDELNTGRAFKIQVTDTKSGKEVFKQVDIFAKDDDSVIVAECKSSNKKTARSLQKDIMEFAALQKSIAKAVNDHYGRGNKLKFVWLFVTRNIVIAENDKKRAAHENIQIVGDRDLRYYEEIAKNIGRAAKYQFLAEFLAGVKVRNLEDQVVPAIRAKIGGHQAYYFLVSPDRLLPIAFVNHRSLRDPSGYPSYQRLIKRSRLKQIAGFLDGGGYFPNSILVNFKKRVRFDIKQGYDERHIHFGDLYLPDAYKTAWIIDGQHRLYGFAEAERRKSNSIAVVAFENIPRQEEAELFATVNGKQAKVSRTILDELEGDLKFESDDFKERCGAIAARSLMWLDAENGGPFGDRMKTPETEESDTVCLTISELKKAIVQSGLIGRPGSKDRVAQPGCLSRSKSEDTLEALSDLLSQYFDAVRTANVDRWEAGRPGHICMNIGVAGYVRLLAALIDLMSAQTHQSASDLDAGELVEQIAPYLEPVLVFVAEASDGEFEGRFKPIFGSGGPPRYFYELAALVHAKFPAFNPAGFSDYQKTKSTEETRLADTQARRVVDKVHQHVVAVLQDNYGPNGFAKAVPQKDIKVKCFERQQDAKADEQLPIESYLDLVDLKKIVEHSQNWKLFESTLSIPVASDRKGLAKYVSWFDRLNDIRKIMAHPTNRSYKSGDVAFLSFLEAELDKRIGA